MTVIAASNVLWLVIYLLIIRAGIRDRSYGMPVVALCVNLAWEANYTFVRPYEGGLWLTNAAWLLLDCGILYTVVRYGPAEFRPLPARLFLPSLAALMVMCWFGTEALIRHFEAGSTVENGATYSALALNLAMSGLFLAMLAQRRSAAGQSRVIALGKLLAGLGVAAGVRLWVRDGTVNGSALLDFLVVSVVLLDAAYLAALHAVARARAPEAGPAGARRPAPRTEAP
ncbi:hypothetical protein SAMN05421773_114158 [Streptomyces aidingensis]|uniref:Uncharacterized protein n=2 Tax=Streptomyces aidingensis TaxID=910347 RepID=A0A1I1S2L7_9ACTN|nr:hypothetical protein SAMN05421773_114158 [Streptomyces aidingensis]